MSRLANPYVMLVLAAVGIGVYARFDGGVNESQLSAPPCDCEKSWLERDPQAVAAYFDSERRRLLQGTGR